MDVVCHDHKRMQTVMAQFGSTSFNDRSDTCRDSLFLHPNRTTKRTIKGGIYPSKMLSESLASG